MIGIQKKCFAVCLKTLAFVFRKEGCGIRTQCKLIDEHNHFLLVGEGTFHEVKGKLQCIRGGGNAVLPFADLVVEAGAHGIEGFIGIQFRCVLAQFCSRASA